MLWHFYQNGEKDYGFQHETKNSHRLDAISGHRPECPAEVDGTLSGIPVEALKVQNKRVCASIIFSPLEHEGQQRRERHKLIFFSCDLCKKGGKFKRQTSGD